MGAFKIRRAAIIVGGSAQLGADVNVYRSAANYLKTDDSFVVGGSAIVIPYATSSPALTQNGEMVAYFKGGTPRLAVRIGGTSFTMAWSGGTLLTTVNSIP